MKELTQVLILLLAIPLIVCSFFVSLFLLYITDILNDSTASFFLLIMFGFTFWILIKIAKSNIENTGKILLSIILFVLAPWFSLFVAKFIQTTLYEFTPLYVHSVEYSPDSKYKVIIKRLYSSPNFNGDGGGYQYTYSIKRNNNFSFPIIKHRGKPTHIVWSKDCRIVSMWSGSWLSYAYDIQTGKRLSLEDDIPLSPLINLLNLSINRSCYPDFILSEAEVFTLACQIGDLPVIQYAIQKELIDEQTLTKGHEAALSARQHDVVDYFNHMESFHYRLDEKLFIAVSNRRWPQFLLYMIYASEDDINYQNADGISLLMNASQKGMLNFVEKLVKSGADIHIFDSENHNALYWAMFYQHEHVVDYLAEQGAKLIRDDLGHLLFEAASKGDQQVFNLCIQSAKEDQLNHHDIDELTPLIIASQKGRIEMVIQLVEAGANVNSADVSYETAVRHAFFNKHYDITEYLIRNGADPGVYSIHGHTFLHDPKMQEIIQKIIHE